MAWVKFTDNFDWRVARTGRTIAYETGAVLNVTRACADRAVEKKKAVRMVKTHRDAAPVEVADA